jgi:hypothetical protein
MVQKRHQEEISGPLDLIESAPLAKDLPRPKRIRLLSRKAQENSAQNEPSEVSSSRAATRVKTAPSDPSLINGVGTSASDQQQLPFHKKGFKQTRKKAGDIGTKEEWQKQFEC